MDMSDDVTSAAQWANFATITPFSPVANIQMCLLSGKEIMMNMVTIEPGGVVPEHSHPNEQCGYVVKGTLILTLGDETRHLGPGDCYVVPSNLVHSGATTDEGCMVLDMFAPPRADYVAMAREAAATSAG